jgi:diaminopimelate decarboxylase
MDYFNYRGNNLYVEDINIEDIAKKYSTPCYVYSQRTIERHWHAFDDVFANRPHLICYSVKANSNINILRLLNDLGSGFDIVSIGELERVLYAGGDAKKIVFSGVGKTEIEIRRALEVGIRCFNVESEAELTRIESIAGELNVKAPISLRVNPDVDAKTHPYISTGLKENKFGISIDKAFEIYRQAAKSPNLNIIGIDCHIGSQLTSLTPFLDAVDRLLVLVKKLAECDIKLKHLDLGGGLGVCYKNEKPPLPADYAKALDEKLDKSFEIILEPGRAIMANAGVLVTKVEYLKHNEDRNFAIVDAAMNDLLRPSLYQAWQNILPTTINNIDKKQTYNIVGPICETGDFLGKERKLAIKSGDFLVVRSAGAYGFSMSSNYNSRPRCAEIMVHNDEMKLIRRRETINELFALEIQ